MKYFLRLSCFAFMFGIYLAVDNLCQFLPRQEVQLPKCPPYEIFKFCVNNCSNCEQRASCILRDCKENGCDCITNFARLTPGGPCVPVSMCPKPECGENEVYRECGPACERCGTFNCRMAYCEYRCYCRQGYKRNAEGKCIPEDECPPRTLCTYEEEWKDIGPEEDFCLHEEGEIVSNSTRNSTQCYCQEGFKRNGLGYCIAERYCPIVKCAGIETYQSCPRKCNTTCRSYGDPNCVEDGQCYPGCFCPEGYIMNDFRICVTPEKCPPGSNPLVPTLPPPVETTIPSSGNVQQNDDTTPTDNEEEELPDNLPDEDIEEAESEAEFKRKK